MSQRAPFKLSTTPLMLLIVLVLAAAVRVPQLDWRGYFLDELWTTELAAGRGSVHLNLPFNRLMPAPPPDVYELNGAPPWWHVWTHMECTHPPLYFVVLRLWMQIFGQGETITRALSVVASLVATMLLFDVVRLLQGPGVAAWAAVLMALAEPQVEYARQTRNYAMMLALALAAADALVRIERLGLNRRRLVGLTLAALATLLTHYFAAGLVAGLFVFAICRLRGQVRRRTLTAFALVALIFAVSWGPFMWHQRRLFSTSDEATLFLHEGGGSGHVLNTLKRLAEAPGTLLAPNDQPAVAIALAIVGIALLALPPILLRNRPDLLLWILWLDCTMGMLACLDLARGTAHLGFVRYTLAAAPAVYALLPAIVHQLRRARWLRIAAPLAAAIYCAGSIPHAYRTWIVDPRAVAAEIGPMIHPGDLFTIIATPGREMTAQTRYLMFSRYISPFPCPIELLDKPAGDQLLASLPDTAPSKRTFASVEDHGIDPRPFLPGLAAVDGRFYLGQGEVWFFEPSQRATTLPLTTAPIRAGSVPPPAAGGR
jgi:hypothetical protein